MCSRFLEREMRRAETSRDEQWRSGHAVTFLPGNLVVHRVMNCNNPILKIRMHEQVFQWWSMTDTFLSS